MHNISNKILFLSEAQMRSASKVIDPLLGSCSS